MHAVTRLGDMKCHELCANLESDGVQGRVLALSEDLSDTNKGK